MIRSLGGYDASGRRRISGTVMRPPLRRDLRYACVLDAEFFSQQGTFFVEPVVLC